MQSIGQISDSFCIDQHRSNLVLGAERVPTNQQFVAIHKSDCYCGEIKLYTSLGEHVRMLKAFNLLVVVSHRP